jgi:hypothetical protein
MRNEGKLYGKNGIIKKYHLAPYIDSDLKSFLKEKEW